MANRSSGTELSPSDQERLELLRRVNILMVEHRDELSPEALGKPNPLDRHMELVRLRVLTSKEIDQLYGKGFYRRYMLEGWRKSPEGRQAVAEVRRLRDMLARERWQQVEQERGGAGTSAGLRNRK